MESVLTKACTIKIDNFEGPFDLLFHLMEKNQVSIYDIPVNIIADQYMEYLFAMKEMDLEIASEFLVMAATLLHIKSRMLLPEKKEQSTEEVDPREELIMRLIEYRKYKDFSGSLREREREWSGIYYKTPEIIKLTREDEILELDPLLLKKYYSDVLARNLSKINRNVSGMNQIIQQEKVSLKSKMREVIRNLINRTFFRFSELFSLRTGSKMEVVTGFLAILELAKLKKVKLDQKQQFSDIYIHKSSAELDMLEIPEEKLAADS